MTLEKHNITQQSTNVHKNTEKQKQRKAEEKHSSALVTKSSSMIIVCQSVVLQRFSTALELKLKIEPPPHMLGDSFYDFRAQSVYLVNIKITFCFIYSTTKRSCVRWKDLNKKFVHLLLTLVENHENQWCMFNTASNKATH